MGRAPPPHPSPGGKLRVGVRERRKLYVLCGGGEVMLYFQFQESFTLSSVQYMRTLLCTCQYRPAPCRPTNSLYCSALSFSGLKCTELEHYLKNTNPLPGQAFKGTVSIVCNHVNRARINAHS
jgi:hypothetical protein